MRQRPAISASLITRTRTVRLVATAIAGSLVMAPLLAAPPPFAPGNAIPASPVPPWR